MDDKELNKELGKKLQALRKSVKNDRKFIVEHCRIVRKKLGSCPMKEEGKDYYPCERGEEVTCAAKTAPTLNQEALSSIFSDLPDKIINSSLINGIERGKPASSTTLEKYKLFFGEDLFDKYVNPESYGQAVNSEKNAFSTSAVAKPNWFLCRDNELKELKEKFIKNKVTVICADGGVGKTTLATQFLSEMEKDKYEFYQTILFSEKNFNEDTFVSEIKLSDAGSKDLNSKLEGKESTEEKINVKKDFICGKLKSSSVTPVFLLDDFSSIDKNIFSLIEEKYPNCKFIVTTRNASHIGNNYTDSVLRLNYFSEDDALKVFKEYRKEICPEEITSEQFKPIYDWCGGNAEVLYFIAKMLGGRPISKFREFIKNKMFNAENKKEKVNINSTMAEKLNLLFGLDDFLNQSATKTALTVMSITGMNPIPRESLIQFLSEDVSEDEADEILNNLKEKGFIKIGENSSVYMHPLMCNALKLSKIENDCSDKVKVFSYLITNQEQIAIDYHIKDMTEIIIPKGISKISDFAFKNYNNLTSVTIPGSVKFIGWDAFVYCNNLKSVYIKDIASWCNITFNCHFSNPLYYAENLYLNNELVTNLTIPNSTTEIKDYAFIECLSLTSIIIPNSIKNIGNYAFECCYKLVEIYNLSNLNIIKGSEDNGCIGEYAINIYTNANVSSKQFVTKDEYMFCNDGETYYLFGYNGNKKALTLPKDCNGKTYKIHKYAFYNMDITSITVQHNVTSIDENAFFGCHKLVEIYNLSNLNIEKNSDDNGGIGYYALNIYKDINTPSKQFVTEDGYMFCDDGEIYYLFGYKGNEKELTLPESCNGKTYEIYKYAFYNTDITSITMPDNITNIGNGAFFRCINLTSITIPNKVKIISNWTFFRCRSLTSIIIPDSVTSIGDWAFYYCRSLTSITIPDKVKIIGEKAFSSCKNLINITIPGSITNIEERAFGVCYNLKKVYYKGNEDDWNKININILGNDYFILATRYYYSENRPTGKGNYWHYSSDGNIAVW